MGSSVLYCCSDVAHKLAVIISGQTMVKEEAVSSKMLVPIYQTTWCHIPKDHNDCLNIFVNTLLCTWNITEAEVCKTYFLFLFSGVVGDWSIYSW